MSRLKKGMCQLVSNVKSALVKNSLYETLEVTARLNRLKRDRK